MDTSITELTPLSFLHRSSSVFADKTALVYGGSTWSYQELAAEVKLRAHALRAAGVKSGDRVAYMMPNVPEMMMAHFAVPLAGAVIVAINTRLASDEIRWILDHCEATAFIVDAEFTETVAPIANSLNTVKFIATSVDLLGTDAGESITGAISLDDLLDQADQDPDDLSWTVENERAPISINYTSGTTGRPKGVVYTHRGAYLNSFGEIMHSQHNADSVYLWTLPMFHCNGWCTIWALVAAGGVQICMRNVRSDVIWSLIDRHRVTHLNGAPTVVSTIMSAQQAHKLGHSLIITTGGAPPSPSTTMEMEAMGFVIVHIYGLTETYGPYSVCQWQDSWQVLGAEQQATKKARQGVGMVQADRLRVVEHGHLDGTLVDIPADGNTVGEIIMRGNNVMDGYYKDPDATATAFAGGWFHSGDLGVMHPDGYVELRDRAKDIIISGGENISTVEVEQAIGSHEGVLEVAVIGVPDQQWGERPKAFVVPRPGRVFDADDILQHVRSRIAHYKAPRDIEVINNLPKTSTGKVQKFNLRNRGTPSESAPQHS